MNTLKLTSQFKKDLKRYKHKTSVVSSLESILKKLAAGYPIPEKHRPHPLTGDYKGYMECHVESDILLVWYDKEEGVVKLIRFGSHSEIFGKGIKR